MAIDPSAISRIMRDKSFIELVENHKQALRAVFEGTSASDEEVTKARKEYHGLQRILNAMHAATQTPEKD